MDAVGATGFWSYVHADNDGDAGRIVDLAHDLQSRYGLITGGDLELFLDRDALDWGDRWRDRVNDALTAATFFIPILTPRFFNSPECRRELIVFAKEARRLGVSSLVLPILYARVSDLEDGYSGDEAVELLRPLQYEDWTSLRLEDRASPGYRLAVERLASRLAEAVVEVSSYRSVSAAARQADESEEDDDTPGALELWADAEDAMPRWQAVVEALTSELARLTDGVAKASADMAAADATGTDSAKSKLVAAARLATQMRGPTDEILRLGEQNSEEVRVVDAALTSMFDEIERAATPSPGERMALLERFEVFEGLAERANGMTVGLTQLSDVVGETARFTRLLRPIARDLQKGLRGFVDAQALYDEWSRRASAIRTRFAQTPSDSSDA